MRVEDLSCKNIDGYKERAGVYFLAEVQKLQLIPGQEEEMKKRYRSLFEMQWLQIFKIIIDKISHPTPSLL